MNFRKSGLYRLTVLALSLCVLMSAVSSNATGEAKMTEEQINEASKEAYDEAKRQGETEIAFTAVVTLGQYLSDLMTYTYGEIPVSETDSANAAVQLVDEVIRRADICFRSEKAGTDGEKLAAFGQATEAWKAAAVNFGGEGETFEAGLPLTDERVSDPATDAFDRIPAKEQATYLEKAEQVYRTIWKMIRPAVAAKAGETLGIGDLTGLAGSGELEEIEDTATDFLVILNDTLSALSDGFYAERSEERARIEQIRSRLNTLESEVKLVINALGIDTMSRLESGGE